ncbi:MAG: zinc-binding alcohol dehydrogenase [Anaerolineales bacterium]|nr:zinc-binding alcohol dehydrogenase [Chloroflexota bacterium]MBL6981909.1 zinc-binding alcohol dehydrogenase [Anaerolineales bacterium]
MKRQSLYFEGPRRVGIREEELPALKPEEVLVRSIASAISPGTEMLIYGDQAPLGLSADSTIEALDGQFNYPFKYGYSLVGEVIELGDKVASHWLGKIVFAFNPHESHFVAHTEYLHPIPNFVSVEDAIFLPNMETAINFVMDGKPQIGERVAVFGQGIVGLLTTSLLSEFPNNELVTFDNYENRRNASLSIGADKSLSPSEMDVIQDQWLGDNIQGSDLIFELSGSPEALNQAIQLTGFESRIIIGSWYGEKKTPLELGREFHRNRIKLISSQVSTIAAEFQGRWDKSRRFDLVWEKLAEIKPSRFITHRFPLECATEAYQLLDQAPKETIQVIFEYPE